MCTVLRKSRIRGTWSSSKQAPLYSTVQISTLCKHLLLWCYWVGNRTGIRHLKISITNTIHLLFGELV